MGAIASQITSLTIVYSTVYSDADQRKHQSSASLAFVRGIHRGPVNSPNKWPITRKMFAFDDVIMILCLTQYMAQYRGYRPLLLRGFNSDQGKDIGIDTNIEVIVVSLTTWEAHHSPRAKPEGCGELPRSLMRQQWPKLRYQFLFYYDETKLIMNKQILSI